MTGLYVPRYLCVECGDWENPDVAEKAAVDAELCQGCYSTTPPIGGDAA